MLDGGVHLKAVSTLLGHAGTQITADTYAHLTAPTAKRALDGLGAALGGRTQRLIRRPLDEKRAPAEIELDGGRHRKRYLTMSNNMVESDRPAIDTATIKRLKSQWNQIEPARWDAEPTGLFASPEVTDGNVVSGHLTLDADNSYLEAAVYLGDERQAREAIYINSLDDLKRVRSVVGSLIQQWTDEIPQS